MKSTAPPRVFPNYSMLIGAERPAEQGHAVFLKDAGDGGAVGSAAAGRAKLFVEMVPAAGGIDHDDLGALIGEVQEGMRHFGGQVGEAALVDVVDRVADAD